MQQNTYGSCKLRQNTRTTCSTDADRPLHAKGNLLHSVLTPDQCAETPALAAADIYGVGALQLPSRILNKASPHPPLPNYPQLYTVRGGVP